MTIPVPLWFIIFSLVFCHLSYLVYSGFLQFKGNFIRGQSNLKYHDSPCNPIKCITRNTCMVMFVAGKVSNQSSSIVYVSSQKSKKVQQPNKKVYFLTCKTDLKEDLFKCLNFRVKCLNFRVLHKETIDSSKCETTHWSNLSFYLSYG